MRAASRGKHGPRLARGWPGWSGCPCPDRSRCAQTTKTLGELVDVEARRPPRTRPTPQLGRGHRPWDGELPRGRCPGCLGGGVAQSTGMSRLPSAALRGCLRPIPRITPRARSDNPSWEVNCAPNQHCYVGGAFHDVGVGGHGSFANPSDGRRDGYKLSQPSSDITSAQRW